MSDTALTTTVANQSFSLAPRTLSEAIEFAKMMADSELVPKAFRGKPGDVLIAVQMGAEVGLAPMAAIQNIAVINGKPGIYGDAGKAILLAKGCVIDEDDIEVTKKNGRARCKITRPGRPSVERTFSVENAKVAKLWGKEGPWTNYPERQMAWRAFWFAARDLCADLLKGLNGAEELQDYIDATVTAVDGVPKDPQRVLTAAPGEAAPAANGTGTPASSVTTTRGLHITNTKLVTPAQEPKFYEVQVATVAGEVCAEPYVTRDDALYEQLRSVEGSEHLVALTWHGAKRKDGSKVRLLTAIALDEGGAQ